MPDQPILAERVGQHSHILNEHGRRLDALEALLRVWPQYELSTTPDQRRAANAMRDSAIALLSVFHYLRRDASAATHHEPTGNHTQKETDQ